MHDYDRTPTFDLKITAGASMPLGQLTKLFVDGEQLGLISSIEMKVTADNRDQYMRIGVLEGLSAEGWAASSENVKKTARTVIAKLQRFPLVRVVCPDYLK